MIGTSWQEFLFIRLCIAFLHYIAPLSAIYCFVISILRPYSYRIPLVLEIWLVAETLFYFCIYLPRYYVLQRDAAHPPIRPREERRNLFDQCHESVEDPEQYLSMWFKGAPASEIRRENLKDFFCWAFLNKARSVDLHEELEEYTVKMEQLLGRKLEPGRGNARPLRLTMDRVQMLHRSLFWYLVSVITGCS